MKTKFKTSYKSQKESILENSNFLNNQNYVINKKIINYKLYLIKKSFNSKLFLKEGINKIHKHKVYEWLKDFLPFIWGYILFMSIFILIILSWQIDSWIIFWIVFINIWFFLAIYWFIKNNSKRDYKFKIFFDNNYFIINKYYIKKNPSRKIEFKK